MTDAVLRIAHGLGVHEMAGVVFIAPLPDGPITVLQGASAEIWRRAYGRSRAHLIAHLAEEFGVDAAVIAPEVSAFLDALVARSLLREEAELDPFSETSGDSSGST